MMQILLNPKLQITSANFTRVFECDYANRNIPVVVIDEEKEKAPKSGYITLYTKLFMGGEV
jgi:hypothetical protein